MQNVIRNGFISSFDANKGTARVYYPDQENTTTDFPCFAFTGEYAPYEIGEQVLVVHFSNDLSSGVVLGRFWDDEKYPQESVSYKKELGNYASEELRDGVLTIKAPEICFECSCGKMTLEELIALKERVERLERRE